MNSRSRTSTNRSRAMASATEIQTPSPTTPTRRDFRQEVTDSMIQMLENGVAPCQKPWEPGALELPYNPTTVRGYRGGNALHLIAVGESGDYKEDHRGSSPG